MMWYLHGMSPNKGLGSLKSFLSSRQCYKKVVLPGVSNFASPKLNCRYFGDSVSQPLSKLSSRSLGLFDFYVKPQLPALNVLPEIQEAMSSEPTSSTLEGLLRAVKILEGMDGGLSTAASVLLADSYQEMGLYQNAISTLEHILSKEENSDYRLYLALCKALCYNGDLDRAFSITVDLLEEDRVQSSIHARGSMLSLQGTIQMLRLRKDRNDFQDAQDSITLLRVAARSMEPNVAAASAYNNLGVAQLAGDFMFLDRVRVDPSMKSFHQALELANTDLLRGRIFNNMATTLLLEDNDTEMLKLASEYTRSALSIFETSTTLTSSEQRTGLGRALSLAASCYFRTGSAVTAEGLFQTAVEKAGGTDPLSKIAHHEAYQNYSELCRQWENRHSDSERLAKESQSIHDSLPEVWKNKPSIISGLSFGDL